MVPIEATRKWKQRIIGARVRKISNKHIHPCFVGALGEPSWIKMGNDGSSVDKVTINTQLDWWLRNNWHNFLSTIVKNSVHKPIMKMVIVLDQVSVNIKHVLFTTIEDLRRSYCRSLDQHCLLYTRRYLQFPVTYKPHMT
jgi:hypothetical protein